MDTLLYGMVCSASNQAMITSTEDETSCSIMPESSQELLPSPQQELLQVNAGYRGESPDDAGEAKVQTHEVSLSCRVQEVW